MGRACTAIALAIAGLGLYASARSRWDSIKDDRVRLLCGKSAVFLGGTALWSALCVAAVGLFEDMHLLVLVSFLLVLGYLTLEVGTLRGYTGSLEALEGSPDIFFERSTQIATVAFALGTLLVSQKDTELARRLGPVVFLALLFAVVPSLAVGQTARRRMATNPELGAVQRLAVSFAAGLLCVALALSVEHIRIHKQWT